MGKGATVTNVYKRHWPTLTLLALALLVWWKLADQFDQTTESGRAALAAARRSWLTAIMAAIGGALLTRAGWALAAGASGVAAPVVFGVGLASLVAAGGYEIAQGAFPQLPDRPRLLPRLSVDKTASICDELGPGWHVADDGVYHWCGWLGSS